VPSETAPFKGAFFNTEAKCNNISFELKQGEVSVFLSLIQTD